MISIGFTEPTPIPDMIVAPCIVSKSTNEVVCILAAVFSKFRVHLTPTPPPIECAQYPLGVRDHPVGQWRCGGAATADPVLRGGSVYIPL